jgi:LemA protein
MIEALVVIGIAAAVVLLVLLSTFNLLTQQRDEVRQAWGHMDEQLKQRYQLIPELLIVVRSVGGEPVSKLPAVTAAKNQAAIAFNPGQLAQAESALTLAIREVLAAGEQHAELNSIRRTLLSSEKKIEQAHREYNHRVLELNDSLHTFPTAITAKLTGQKPQPVFGSAAES